MPIPATLIIGSVNGLVTLDDNSQSLDPDGTVRATARYVCYPPEPGYYPTKGSSHPRFNSLKLVSRDVRMDGPFAFIDAHYEGLPSSGLISEEAQSHVRVGWWLAVNEDGSMGYKKYQITNTVTRRTYLTTGGAPSSSEDEAVSFVTENGITRYTVETTTETRVEVPET